MDALAAEMQRDLAEVAEVRWTEPHAVELVPKNERAVGVAWFDTGDELQIETLGGIGGRWELAGPKPTPCSSRRRSKPLSLGG